MMLDPAWLLGMVSVGRLASGSAVVVVVGLEELAVMAHLGGLEVVIGLGGLAGIVDLVGLGVIDLGETSVEIGLDSHQWW